MSEPIRPDAPTRALPRLFSAVTSPVQAFLQLEAASGTVLLACAVAALLWANLAGESYRAFLAFPFRLGLGDATAQVTLRALVDDGLMTIFFFVVGMEIKRELVRGELRSPGQALLPAVAALGGMLLPALIFLAFNAGGPGLRGWGIPVATDIAFCVGVLTLLRRYVPRGLVVFLTALAIFDDIGGILVIALFYGGGVDLAWLASAAGTTLVIVAMARAQVRSAVAYAAAGVGLWVAFHGAGIHPTLAGVVLGLAVPASLRQRPGEVLLALGQHVDALNRRHGDRDDALDEDALDEIEERLAELQSPLDRFVQLLHPWVAFAIMPAFALANAGVALGGGLSIWIGPVALGTALGLLAGKTAGIFGFTRAAVRLGLARVPGEAGAGKLLGVSAVGGIGFTVSLFIAGLAFRDDPALLDQAKIGILVGSVVSGLAGAAILSRTRPLDIAVVPAGAPPQKS
jgi:NhaA family Na+:H+ antiporter